MESTNDNIQEGNSSAHSAHYIIKFVSQSDIKNWKPALDEFSEELENSKIGKITGETFLSKDKYHKSFTTINETAALQLLLNLGKKHCTTGRIKIIKLENDNETIVFHRSTKAYK
jgi:hypothetical protein